MSTKTIVLDDTIITEMEEDDGWHNQGCNWDDSPCGRLATFRVTMADDSKLLFCERHLAPWLAHMMDVHIPLCSGTLSGHVKSITPILG